MKFTLKLLLLLCIVLAGIYAATPLWLPYILAGQLPPGWQLEQLEAAYPGLTGIDIRQLRLKGDLQMAVFTVAATDIRFNYKDLKTAIGSVSLDARIKAAKSGTDDALTLDDLSLPVVRLSAKLPELSVNQVRMTLHPDTHVKAGDIASVQPLVVVFGAFKLIPISDSSFHLVTNANFEELPGITGQLELDMTPNLLKATARLQADADSQPWLTLNMDQQSQIMKPTTRIQLSFNADSINTGWLDSLLVRSTGGWLSHAGGKLELQAVLAGQALQSIEHVSLVTEKLQVISKHGSWNADVELTANRDGEKVSITLPAPAEFHYQDQTAWIDQLLTKVFPGLQRTPGPQAKIFLQLDQDSTCEVQIGASPSLRFNGDGNFSLTSNRQSLKLTAVDFLVEMVDIRDLETTTASGLVTLDWDENAAIAWSSAGLNLKADGLEMQGRIDLDISMSEPDSPTGFYFNGALSATKPVIGLPGDEQNPSLSLTAADLSITAEVRSQDEKLVSTGGGTLMAGNITPLATSADRIDMTWQDLDLGGLTGNLSTKTQGFSTEFEAEKWTGFDFDVTYTLHSDADVSGSGKLKFESGPEWPIEFTGNTQAEHWDIKLPATTFELAQLRKVLRVAHFELPGSVKLTDGYIDLQGAVVADDEVSARMVIKGYEMGASMLASSAHNASFLFNLTSDHMISASGPFSIESIALAGGINVANIRADLKFENMETYGLQNLYAELFGGQARLLNLQFSNNRIEDSTIELSRIDLGSLLEFADIDGLEGVGTLEISLPVGSDSTGIHIKNGTFVSTGPGRLAYTTGGVASSNIGLRALENFQYQVLSGTVDYQSDGAYRITIRLEGKNPDLYEGHPVVFNLNIGGLLPELFEALFLTGDFEESILNQIRIK